MFFFKVILGHSWHSTWSIVPWFASGVWRWLILSHVFADVQSHVSKKMPCCKTYVWNGLNLALLHPQNPSKAMHGQQAAAFRRTKHVSSMIQALRMRLVTHNKHKTSFRNKLKQITRYKPTLECIYNINLYIYILGIYYMLPILYIYIFIYLYTISTSLR